MIIDNNIKILVVVVIVLIGVLGVTMGMLLQGYLSSPNTTNQNQNANITTVNQTNSTTQTKQQDGFISASKAISIVKANEDGPSGNVKYSATLIKSSENPYYKITVYDNDPSSDFYGEAVGGATVDAKTGEFLGGMG